MLDVMFIVSNFHAKPFLLAIKYGNKKYALKLKCKTYASPLFLLNCSSSLSK